MYCRNIKKEKIPSTTVIKLFLKCKQGIVWPIFERTLSDSMDQVENGAGLPETSLTRSHLFQPRLLKTIIVKDKSLGNTENSPKSESVAVQGAHSGFLPRSGRKEVSTCFFTPSTVSPPRAKLWTSNGDLAH